jgi:hypothetical protein
MMYPLAALILSIAANAGTAIEDEPPASAEQTFERLPKMGFPPRRWMAFRTTLTGIITASDADDLRTMGGVRMYYSPYIGFDAPAFEWSLIGGGYFGSWGDDEHGDVTLEAGGGLRLRAPPTDFFAGGPLANVTLLYSLDGQQLGGRLDVGATIDVGRVLGLDVFATGMLADFAKNEGTDRTRFAVGGGAELTFDVCSVLNGTCEHLPRAPEVDDRTCNLYTLGNELCGAPGPREPAGNLCDAVARALDTSDNPLMGRDAVTALLEGAMTHANAEAARVLNALLARHRFWRHWLEDGRRAQRIAGMEGSQLAVKRQYAPYPVELAHAIGCDGARTCEYVCD